MYLQKGEGHLITVDDVLSSGQDDTLSDPAARQHMLDSAKTLTERGGLCFSFFLSFFFSFLVSSFGGQTSETWSSCWAARAT